MDLQWANLNLEDVVQNAESNRFSQSTTFKLTFSFWFFCKQLWLDYSDSWTSILIRILLMKPFLISSETKHNLQFIEPSYYCKEYKPWIAGTSLHAKRPKCHHPPYRICTIVVGTQNTPTKIPESAKFTVYIFLGFRLFARARKE